MYNIDVLSPIRGKNPLDWSEDGLAGKSHTLYTEGGFVPRDLRDIRRADAVLLHFADPPKRQSIGTWTEFGIAVERRIPIVVSSEIVTVVSHPFVYRLAAKVCPTLQQACDYLGFLLK